MVLQLVVELEDLGDERGLERRGGVLERHPVEHAAAELFALGLVQDAGARFESGQHAIAIEQRGREPVVVHDLGFLALGELERRKCPPHPKPQIVGGLVRERQTQHVAWHHAGAVHAAERAQRQVHDARCHHGGLARTRAGDQHARFERPGDRIPLLVRGFGAHRGDDLGRCDARAHGALVRSNTGWPSGNRGHSGLKSHQKQSAVGLGR